MVTCFHVFINGKDLGVSETGVGERGLESISRQGPCEWIAQFSISGSQGICVSRDHSAVVVHYTLLRRVYIVIVQCLFVQLTTDVKILTDSYFFLSGFLLDVHIHVCFPFYCSSCQYTDWHGTVQRYVVAMEMKFVVCCFCC